MGRIELKAQDGHVLEAYCAQPEAPQGAIVVLQEIFGVNPHIRSLCDRYCEQGYLAVAPALFDRVARSQVLGYDADGVARGREIRGQISDEQGLLDVQAAIGWAWQQPGSAGRVAAIGFCWGGTLAWLSAARVPGLRCAVAYYVDEGPKVPVLLHFGIQDAHIPPPHVDKIARHWPDLPLYRYDAGHGFNCDDRPAYHEPSAQLAGRRTREFLKEQFQSC